MKKARVLIVDDAALIRRIITDALSAEPTIEVAGEAEDGRTALQRIAQLKPDLVTLDIELPGMNGLETLREIRKVYPRLPVIMFSAFTERGAADTLEALHNGASDYVTKPASSGGKALAKERICQDLIPKIRSLCRVGPEAGTGRPGAAPKPFSMRPLGTATRADAVAIAVVHRRAAGAHDDSVEAAPGLPRSDFHRPAHAEHVHAPARRTAGRTDAAHGRRGDRRASGASRPRSTSRRATRT